MTKISDRGLLWCPSKLRGIWIRWGFLGRRSLKIFVAFASNAKSFAITILVFFPFFFFSSLFLDGLAKVFLQRNYCVVIYDTCDKDWTCSFSFLLFHRILDGCLKLFSKRFIINYKGSVWPRSDSFLGHIKKSFRKKCRSSCYSRRV